MLLLAERCREVFLFHRVESFSYSQIAAHLGVSVSAVEKNIARACLAQPSSATLRSGVTYVVDAATTQPSS
jgi:hypothetical protein